MTTDFIFLFLYSKQEESEDWPPEPIYSYYMIVGDLRDKILAKTNKVGPVTIKTVDYEGGYSECTVEYDWEMEIYVDGVKVFGNGGGSGCHDNTNMLRELVEWLNEEGR